MWVVFVVEWVDDVISDRDDVKGDVAEDAELGESWQSSRVIVIALSSALLIVYLAGCDLTSICVVVCVDGLTMDAPSVGFPVFWEPFVYM